MADQAFTFLPGDDDPIRDDEALSVLENVLEGAVSEADLVIAPEPLGPLGKSWSFDFALRSFLTGAGGPLPTRDLGTMGSWIEKALNTARGAHPACPPGFGMPPGDPVVGSVVGYPPADLSERIHAAVTAHPRISDVKELTYNFDEDEDWLAVNFTIVTDEDEQLPVAGIVVTQL